MADWSALPRTAVVLIARSLQLIEDFIAFRSTCSSWRDASNLKDFYTSSSSCPKLPLLMLVHFERKDYFETEKERRLLELRLQSLGLVQSKDPEAHHQHDEMDEYDPQPQANHENNSEMDENEPPEVNHEIVQSEDGLDLDEEGLIDLKLVSLLESKDDPAENEANYESNIDIFHRKRKDLFDDKHKFVRLIRRDGLEANHERKFLSLSKVKTCNFSYPEAKGMQYRGSKGWLLMVERFTNNMCLFHPISRVHIPLPKLPMQIDYEGFKILPQDLRSVALSASPSETSEDYVVMAVYFEKREISPGKYELRTYTGFWKPGNLTWTKVDIPYVDDLIYYNGKFYALTKYAEVWMCDASGPNPTASKIVELPWNWSRPHAQLVECGGRLLTVAPYFCYHYDMEFLDDLEMVEIDVIKGSYNIITCLGSSAVFLGNNEGFSIDTNEFPGIIEPNSIYFGDGSYQVAIPRPNHESEPNYGSGIWFNF